MIGETVTHYRILDKIGEGGMGVVYRAEDTRLGRQVAVKFLSQRLSQEATALERFQREARAASALNHPHICALYDIGQHDSVPFLVMELLSGRTLRAQIQGLPLPLDTILEFAVQIADALDVAHTAGIVHRDVKSANIFVTERGQVKMLDFGLAKLARGSALAADAQTDSGGGSTKTGIALGTLSSMSPEQARGIDLDARTDLFSFGVVLYEMATGREPFTGRTAAMVFEALLRDTPPRPSALNPRIPADLDHIILKALEKDRDLRYQTAAELRGDLKRLRRETDSTRLREPADETVVVPATNATPRPAGRTAWPIATGAAAVVLLLAALGAYLFFGGGAGDTIDSVAVLPFAVEGAAGDTEYLADGITEALINGLTQMPGLRVSARSVVFRYKAQRDADPQQIGRDLNVRAIVTGRASVRGDRIVIQADLMNVQDGSQLWGNQYNRPTADLLAVQDEIASEILDKLRLQISGEQKALVTRRYTDDPAAYQLYLQGRYHWNKGTIAGYRNAIEYFQQAIQKDTRYAMAYAGLADSYLMLGSYWVEAILEAKSAAEQALRLDSSLAEAHVALGDIKLWLDWDWPAAASEFQQGIALNPASAHAHNQYAMFLATQGRVADAIAESRRALDLEPASPIVNSDLGYHLLAAGQRSDAIAQLRKTLDLDSNSVSAHARLGIALSESGQHTEAIAELQRAVSLSENSPTVLGQLGAAYARQGNRAEAERVLRELEALSAREYVPATALATVYAALDDRARALGALERAYEEHDFSIAQMAIAPAFRNLRGEPRFKQILAKLNLQ
jgi:serine/threonine-protein kinase